jgi:hypothetical protein
MKRRDIPPFLARATDLGLPGTVVSCTPVILGKKPPVPGVQRTRKRATRTSGR